MTKAKCIQKFRDKNNHIYGYRLQDQQGNIKDVNSQQLKRAIKNEQIKVINLRLTSDNRIIDKAITENRNQKIEKYMEKAIMLGKMKGSIKAIHTACDKDCQLISLSGTEHILIIPDDVTAINEPYDDYDYVFWYCREYLKGTVKVIGGRGLVDANCMFMYCEEITSLDLSYFDTSKVKDMRRMFSCCSAQSINLSSFNTSRVTDMSSMFMGCKTQSLDLSSFDTSKVKDMRDMFYNCSTQSINLSSFNTSNVKRMNSMFYECTAQSLDLSSFDTGKVTAMWGMFEKCKAQHINLLSFDTSKVKYMRDMFRDCSAKIKAKDAKILEEYARKDKEDDKDDLTEHIMISQRFN